MLDSRLAGWLAIALAVLVVVAVTARWAKRRPRAAPGVSDDRLDTVGGWPPTVTRLLTPAERNAFRTLRQALPEYIVFSQVPLARFIEVPKRNSYADWLRRVGYQSIDFLVCDSNSQVVAVVDLQQPAAQASQRALKRQARIAKILKAAKVPLHAWTANSLPSVELARDSILGLPPAPLLPPGLPGDPGVGLDRATAAEAAAASSARGVGPASAASSATARDHNPFEDTDRDSSQDEFIEAREPPRTTWYDELDSGPTPLVGPGQRPDG